MRALWVLLALATLSLIAHGCDDDRAARLRYGAAVTVGGGGEGGGLSFDAGVRDGPPPLDADGTCGNELHTLSYDAPNLYFVFDRSGSMAEQGIGSANRYQVVRHAAIELVSSLGPLVNVGAALFPVGATQVQPCRVGDEVFATAPGDPPGDEEGPTTKGFRLAISVTPSGGTPTSPTLNSLRPTLESLPGRTIVLLLTDGAPNCNAFAACADAECQAVLDGFCAAGTGCCAPGGEAGPELCIDRVASVAAVEALAERGIDVYVVGIPGSELYASVLDGMALAGGTAQPGPTKYHKVDDLAELGDVLRSIAAEHITCEFALDDPPDSKGMTNVYLGGEILPLDPVNGWYWKGDDLIVLYGDACQALRTGAASQVQIVTGCPTEIK